jgi:nitrite reductase [NAD(P)H] small subunit
MSATTSTRLMTLCRVEDIPAGLGRAFQVAGQPVAVFRSRAGAVFAVANRCPHRGGPLADGMMVGDQVVCPLHAFRFDGRTGACDQAGTCAVPTYPVEVANGVVRIALDVV